MASLQKSPRQQSRTPRPSRDLVVEYGITVEIARQHVPVCKLFQQPGYKSCKDGQNCRRQHVKKDRLYPTAGLKIAKQHAADPSLAVPSSIVFDVHVDPVLGLTTFLLNHNSRLVVHRMKLVDKCVLFFFKHVRVFHPIYVQKSIVFVPFRINWNMNKNKTIPA